MDDNRDIVNVKAGESPLFANQPQSRFKVRNLSVAATSPMSVIPKANNIFSPRVGSILSSARLEAE